MIMSEDTVRNEKGQFAPGVSGNPSGRPKSDSTIQELARAHTQEALNALVEIATKGRSESARVSAAVAILDRGWGRPPMTEYREDETRVKVVYVPEPCNTVEEWAERYGARVATESGELLPLKSSPN
jgi:Family of unknown function (DUF5681)